jgi:hypothetical protein
MQNHFLSYEGVTFLRLSAGFFSLYDVDYIPSHLHSSTQAVFKVEMATPASKTDEPG